MSSIPFHIAYLLTRHECVIVPDLGAFIVFPSDKEKTNRCEIFSPPENSLQFSHKIKYNDGLLANSIAKECSCSDEEANALIAQYVAAISHSLSEGEKVEIPKVGILYSNDNTPLFQPDKMLSCNAGSYGLTEFSLPPLNDLSSQTNISAKENKESNLTPVNRKSINYLGSIALALTAMCIIPTPISHDNFSTAYKLHVSLINSLPQYAVSDSALETEMQTYPTLSQTSPLPAETMHHSSKANTLRYYLVIAILPDSITAEKAIANFQFRGFKTATMLFSDGRYLIYTNYFENKDEAENYIIQFRQDNPSQANAWLLKRRDKFDPFV